MLKTIATLSVFAASSAASAQSFSDRSAFEAAFGAALTLESFEGLTQDSGTAAQDSIAAADFVLTGVNEGFTFLPPLAVQGATSTGSSATDGVQHVNVGSLYNTGQDNDVVLTFDFANPITAFGLDFTGLDNFGSNNGTDVAFSTDAGDMVNVLTGDLSGPTDLFFGFLGDNAFSSVTLRVTAGDSFGIDAASYGIPTPASATLLGLAGVAATRRRR